MISFYLSNAERKVSSISLYCFFKSKRYKKNIGESIEVSKWSTKKQRAKVAPGDIELELLNGRLDSWENAVAHTFDYFKSKPYVPDSQEFFKVLDQFKSGNSPGKHIGIVEYFDTFIDRYKNDRSANRVSHFRTVQNKLKDFQEYESTTLYFEDIDMTFYTKFKHWFMTINGWSTNYFGETIKTIRTVITEAKGDNIHNSEAYHNKKFVAPQTETENIYLSNEELLRIHNLEITDELIREDHLESDVLQFALVKDSLARARDMFLIGAFTGLRYSDFSTLKRENITDTIKVMADKTEIKSIIPLHWVVKEIIERGYDFDRPLTESKLNMYIKDVARYAGINDEVMIFKDQGGKMTPLSGPKWKFVTTHTARRSFATNAYKAGIPPIAIMKVTGHKRESTFMKYIKVDKQENAEMLQNHEFFSKNAIFAAENRIESGKNDK